MPLQNPLQSTRLSTLLPLFLLLLLIHPTPTTPHCENFLQNPSFDHPSLTPWLALPLGSFSTHTLSPHSPHTSPSSYHIQSNTSSASTSSLALSQSYISLPANTYPVGATVSCWAWIRSSRPVGQTRVEIFLDAETCGGVVWVGDTGGEWVRVAGTAVVRDVDGGEEGVGHTVVVSMQGDGVGGEGWSVWVDDVGVGGGC